MALWLHDRWIWDFWFAEDGPDVHVFYLQAPRSLADPDARHRHATVGHAVSPDLVRWTVLPDALGPGPPGSFDDLAVWTGSVIRHDGQWLLFYTGVCHRDSEAVQRIGCARSADLTQWTRCADRPLIDADARWYETPLYAGEQAWRDPWVFWDEDTGLFHMLVTARAISGPADGRGVVGHASSRDLATWRVGPPLSAPGEFSALEVPQLVGVAGGWWILFSVLSKDHSTTRRNRPGVRAEAGTHYLRAAHKLGPYALERDDFLVGDPRGRYYAGRMLRRDGRCHFFAWQAVDDGGEFLGALTDPMPVMTADGGLVVRVP